MYIKYSATFLVFNCTKLKNGQ